MKTIASQVSEFVKSKPYLSTALSQGIINLTSLAREIQPEIEKALRKPARSGAIVMALKRISDNEEFLSTHKIVSVLRNLGDITVRSSLTDYCFKLSETLLLAQAEFLSAIKEKKDIFYTSSRGVGESNIVVSSNIAPLIEDIFRDEICIDKIDSLSAITVKLPNDNVKIPGIYYFIFQRLSWEGVNINEVISTSNEFTILMHEDSVNVAFEVIKNLKSL
ncbi:MAG: aspartate kinase [Flavobacteriaceae bacterium TMED42]|nr:aspartate kinase [Flavobacteriaceae bacterium]MDC0479023.1 aspartate kinase [Flavobacteriaceae bacterium]MDC3239013.1 aspartate kinase [Flavobacteriaceae bacterium]RPG66124.1 MAG: aspartate kinase [Flavobacteriaceae bacterium TMED42]